MISVSIVLQHLIGGGINIMGNRLESDLQLEVLKYLREHRVCHIRFQAQYNLNGLPDIMALYKGVLLGLELKKDDGVPTGLQLRKLDTINENGGVGVIVRSLNQVIYLLNSIDEGKNVQDILKNYV